MIPFLLPGASVRQCGPASAVVVKQVAVIVHRQHSHLVQRIVGAVNRLLASWVHNFPHSCHPVDDQHRASNDQYSRLEASSKRPLLQFQPLCRGLLPPLRFVLLFATTQCNRWDHGLFLGKTNDQQFCEKSVAHQIHQ